MKTASIATARNQLSQLSQLSQLIQRVRRGETILITDRRHPVASLQPVHPAGDGVRQAQAIGLLAPPKGEALDVRAFLQAPRPSLTASRSLTAAALAERREGR